MNDIFFVKNFPFVIIHQHIIAEDTQSSKVKKFHMKIELKLINFTNI